MNKDQSRNLQRRADNNRSVSSDDRKNDLLGFRRSDIYISTKKGGLVAEKKEIEVRLQRLKLDLQTGDFHHPNRRSWLQARIRLSQRMSEVENELASLKLERMNLYNRNDNPLAFVEAFYQAALAALPNEVLERLRGVALAILSHTNAQ